MNILIIGNGFDLAHGLPTKYEHFLKYIKAFERLKLTCMQQSVEAKWKAANDEDKNYILHFSNMYEQKKVVFEEIDTLISNNAWIDYFWKIFLNRKTEESDGWIDFESEISRIIQTLDDARLTISREINQGNETGRMTHQQRTILAPLWEKIGINSDTISFNGKSIPCKKAQPLIDLNRLTRCLELYLEYFVERTEPKVKLPDINNIDIHYVLSFNYTHTYESLYHKDKSKKIHYDYIHGEIKTDSRLETCNLILGIDEYLEGNAKNRDNEFVQFKKFYQRIFKKTGCKYVDWQKKQHNQLWLSANVMTLFYIMSI